jgi:Tfp pilus assembly protein PilO
MWQSRIKNIWQPQRIQALARSLATKRLIVVTLLGFGLIAINLLVYGVVVAPAARRFVADQQQYRDLKKEHAEAVLFQKQKQHFAGLTAGIPAQKDVPLLIKDLVQAARRLHLSVEAINSDIPTPGSGGLTMLTFTFPASGAYADIKRFIYEVETSDRIVGIQDVKLASEKGRVKMQMKLVTYIRGER